MNFELASLHDIKNIVWHTNMMNFELASLHDIKNIV